MRIGAMENVALGCGVEAANYRQGIMDHVAIDQKR